MKISKSAAIQYMMIYLAFMLNDSYLYKVYLMPYNIIIMGFAVVFILTHKRTQEKISMIFMSLLLFFVFFVRIIAGGVGFSAWLIWSVPIAVVMCAVLYDRNNFMNRWVNVVVVMALISLVCWGISQVNPAILRNLFPSHYAAGKSVVRWTSSTSAIYQNEYSDGLLLYSVRFTELERNNGVFSEPGLYQMVLTMTLFMLLFMGKQCKVEEKKRLKYIVILIITIIVCQSTSGYLSLIMMLMVYLVGKEHSDTGKVKRLISVTLLGFAGIMIIEYMVNGNQSILYTQLLRKISSEGAINLSADSGQYRIAAITYSFASMLQHPFGIGFDAVDGIMYTEVAGAQIFIFGAAMGVIPFILLLIWHIYPVCRTWQLSILQKVLYIFMFLNSMLAQSKAVYAVFVIFVIYFSTEYMNEDEPKCIEMGGY